MPQPAYSHLCCHNILFITRISGIDAVYFKFTSKCNVENVKRYLTIDRKSIFISDVKCILGQYAFRLIVIYDAIIM